MENLTKKAEAFLAKKNGSGRGNGNGSGSGRGYGYGYGYGDGYGYGYGRGCGYGRGYGYGYGYGDGRGYGSGAPSYIDGRKVFAIDGLPCVFFSIFRDYAKVGVVEALSTKSMYLAKCGGFLAHGETLKEAMADAKAKYEENRPLSERIAEFWKKFVPGKKYLGSDFFDWHHIITGSCLAGRNEFVKMKGLSVKSTFTPEEFIALCENDYGSGNIKELKKAMPKEGK